MRPFFVAIVCVTTAVSSAGCSVAFQDSVRSSSVYCSTSRFWYVSDLVLASAAVFAGTRAGVTAPIYGTAGVFAGSALLGIYKRHNCVKWQAEAPPEVWAAAAEAERQRQAQAEADRAAAQAAYEAAAEQAAQQAAEQAEQQAQVQQQWVEQQQQEPQQQQQQQQQQQPAPIQVGQRQQPQPRQPPPNQQRPVQVTQTRVVVPPRGTLARSRQQCDAILPLPPMTKNDPFGTAQKMQQMNRDSCYACVDPGKTFAMETPPSHGFIHSCQ